MLFQHKPSFVSRDEIVTNGAVATGTLEAWFALPRKDPRIHALVVALDRDDVPVAATWRAVGEAAWELGLRRPGYHAVRDLVRVERLRRAARTAVRAAVFETVLALGSSRVVDLPIALDALERARAKERLVLKQHKPRERGCCGRALAAAASATQLAQLSTSAASGPCPPGRGLHHAARPCTAGCARNAPSRSPSSPSSTFACRSRFEPSGAAASFTCSARSRSSPTRRSSSASVASTVSAVADVDAGDVEMAGVETDPEPRMPAERVDEQRELVDGAADRAARAGRVLEQEPGRLARAFEHLLERRNTPLEAGLEAGAQVGADVEDDPVRLDRDGGVDRREHGLKALAEDRRVRRREVAQVERVHEHGAEPRLGAPLAKTRARSSGACSGKRQARGLCAKSCRVRSDLDRPVEGPLDAASAVGPVEHGDNPAGR